MKQLRIAGTGQKVTATIRRMVPAWLPGYIRDEFKAAYQTDCQCRGCKAIRIHRDYDLLVGANPLRSQELQYLHGSSYDCQCVYRATPDSPTCGGEISQREPVMWDPSHGAMHLYHFPDEIITIARQATRPLPPDMDGR